MYLKTKHKYSQLIEESRVAFIITGVLLLGRFQEKNIMSMRLSSSVNIEGSCLMSNNFDMWMRSKQPK